MRKHRISATVSWKTGLRLDLSEISLIYAAKRPVKGALVSTEATRLQTIGRLMAFGLLMAAVAGCSQTAGQGLATGPIALAESGPDGNGAHAVVASTVTAGVAGGAIGKELSAGDQRAARDAEYRALEFGRTGVPVSWRNGKDYGEVVPGASYHVNSYDCRDFIHTIFIGGKSQSARGTACRQPNGSWQPVT